MAGVGPKTILTHSQRVCRLYKRALRQTLDVSFDHAAFRFAATVLRARFDETIPEKDMRVQTARLNDAEVELRAAFQPDPSIFKNDPGGICYRRAYPYIDCLFDKYHPWEKVMLADFFDRREELKKEYEVYFEANLTKKYKPEPLVV